MALVGYSVVLACSAMIVVEKRIRGIHDRRVAEAGKLMMRRGEVGYGWDWMRCAAS